MSSARDASAQTAETREAAFCRLLGLEELRAGRHYLRNEDRERVGSIWVEAAWWGEILPSFHPPWGICSVRAKGEKFRQSLTPGWTKAALVASEDSAVVKIVDDPVLKSLPAMNLSSIDNSLTLDGIRYRLHFQTIAFEGSLTFSNPRIPTLKELERGLIRVAEEISSRSEVPSITRVLNVWGEYLDRG